MIEGTPKPNDVLGKDGGSKQGSGLRRHDRWTLGEQWAEQGRPRLLVIDNYDSFTYNLVQMLAVSNVTIDVVRNDRLGVDEILEEVSGRVQGIVLSPGPGRPEDAGVCVELLRAKPNIPILGVCLGQQAMAYASGATVERAPKLMHGKTSRVRYESHSMFGDVEQQFVATRYHSLCVIEKTLPEEWLPLAWSEDGVLMAMAHRELPYWGLQFHPESILTQPGPQLLTNFVDLTESYSARTKNREQNVDNPLEPPSAEEATR